MTPEIHSPKVFGSTRHDPVQGTAAEIIQSQKVSWILRIPYQITCSLVAYSVSQLDIYPEQIGVHVNGHLSSMQTKLAVEQIVLMVFVDSCCEVLSKSIDPQHLDELSYDNPRLPRQPPLLSDVDGNGEQGGARNGPTNGSILLNMRALDYWLGGRIPILALKKILPELLVGSEAKILPEFRV
ncbi:hypothetical protein K438DRAFT_1756179 [Mycena galopus ATCC 62051]|nr:hypothetical protein K438DRAFT_1756179 [Mycena galopus ATCC 62051]